MVDLRSKDTGWYSCAITTSGYDPMVNVHLQVSGVSGALWAEKNVSGVVGRAITIDCHYEAKYRSHTKYWCRGWSRQCSVLVETKGQHGQSGRVSITDNPERGIFTVTMVDLRSEDTGWYSCAITTSGYDPMVNVHLQVSDEPVSVPVLQVLSSLDDSCVGGSVSVVCKSVQGSFPIQYTWYEKTSSVDSKISGTSKLDLRCQSFKHQHHQYYCTASNTHGAKSSEMINVVVFSSTWHCSYQLQFSHTVSGALWAEKCVRGVVGREITIDCYYEKKYRSHTKYWCHGWDQQCSVLVETNGQYGRSGRVSIKDYPEWGRFTVTMRVLRSRDTGWYSCGIRIPGVDLRFKVHLQVSHESKYTSETAVTAPMWTSPSKTSVTKSTRTSPSKTSVTESMRTSHSETLEIRFNDTQRNSIQSISAKSYMIWKVGRWLFFALLGIWTIAVTWFTRDKKRSDQLDPHQPVHEEKRRIPD
ncbi:polymeric immunoglobulin receptor-like [Hemitrygon akajei]|uniref:polymeric immunoglobulin receptor-like n=1 Tax=Hemitrygon akajei TaxID=2704970 RepID=UPI003BFA1BF2